MGRYHDDDTLTPAQIDPRTLCAEVNAIINGQADLNNCVAYCVPCLPTTEGARALIQAGITRVVCPDYVPLGLEDDLEEAFAMLNDAEVEVAFYLHETKKAPEAIKLSEPFSDREPMDDEPA